MTDAHVDIAAMFAAAWNSINDDHAVAADFWPCCAVLADARLLTAQETSLTALSIGPFRLVVSNDNRAVLDFVEVLFPSVIAGAASGHTAPAAVSGVLTAACVTFVKLYRQGTVFGRGDTDRLRWNVLIAVRNANGEDRTPEQRLVRIRWSAPRPAVSGGTGRRVGAYAGDHPPIRQVRAQNRRPGPCGSKPPYSLSLTHSRQMGPTMDYPPDRCELTILMPCLNEAETLAVCIQKAQSYLARSGTEGEVLIADNGSTDGSQDIALRLGARLVDVEAKGYGNALMGGIRAARGRYVIMGDADDSYDFANLDPFVKELRNGAELVMGNRFRGGIEPHAMPPLHRYLGNPVLSMVGKLFFKAPVADFHCGLRGFERDAILRIGLYTSGMEFASEIVVKSCLAGLRIVEVPTTLKKDGRSRPPHLRSWRDGWRHLRFLLIFSPRWLYLYPGLGALGVGLVATLALEIGPVNIGHVGFDIGTMTYAAALAILGYQAILFSVMLKLFAAREGFLPMSARYRRLVERFSVERGLIIGMVLFVAGILVALLQLLRWRGANFGAMDAERTIRTAIPAVLGVVLGFQTIMFSMFTGVLNIPTRVGTTFARAPRDEAPTDDPVGTSDRAETAVDVA